MPEDDFNDAITKALPGLTRYAHFLARSWADADDLVQETVARALAQQDSFRAESSPTTWLHSILHNLAVDHARKHRNLVDGDVFALLDAEDIEARWRREDYSVDPQIVAERSALREELRDALIRLPVHYRSAVLLHDLEEIKVVDIAEIHGVSVSAAKQRLRRGRLLLVSALARGHERTQARLGVPLGCWDVRARISDYLDDELDQAKRSLLERHLQICPTCPPLYAGLVGAHAAIHRLRDSDNVIPVRTLERIRRQTHGEPRALRTKSPNPKSH